MALPAIIEIGSAAVVAANPTLLIPILSMHVANAGIRASYEAAKYKVEQESVAELKRIADNLEIDDGGGYTAGLVKVMNRLFAIEDEEEEDLKGLAAIVDEKPSDVNLTINNVASPVEAPYESGWTSDS